MTCSNNVSRKSGGAGTATVQIFGIALQVPQVRDPKCQKDLECQKLVDIDYDVRRQRSMPNLNTLAD